MVTRLSGCDELRVLKQSSALIGVLRDQLIRSAWEIMRERGRLSQADSQATNDVCMPALPLEST